MGDRSSHGSPRELSEKFSSLAKRSELTTPRSALVVDDDMDFCTIVKEMLKWRGFETRVAYSAADALSKLRHMQPQVMLVDIMMPAVDGLELIRKIRSDNKFANTRIIVITARAIMDMLVASKEAGADSFLTKPVSLDELTLAIDRLM